MPAHVSAHAPIGGFTILLYVSESSLVPVNQHPPLNVDFRCVAPPIVWASRALPVKAIFLCPVSQAPLFSGLSFHLTLYNLDTMAHKRYLCLVPKHSRYPKQTLADFSTQGGKHLIRSEGMRWYTRICLSFCSPNWMPTKAQFPKGFDRSPLLREGGLSKSAQCVSWIACLALVI